MSEPMTVVQVIAGLRRFVGGYVRAQLVEDVGLIIETDGEDIRYFPTVYFEEHPVSNRSPELNALERIFSTIPTHADVLCWSWEEVEALASGPEPHEPTLIWRLCDESRAGFPECRANKAGGTEKGAER